MAHRTVKVAVVGDAGVGKTSLISTAANDTFDARPAPVLPPTRLPAEFTPDQVPMVVTDTSSRPEDQQVTDLVLQSSDVVVVCFDATRLATLDSVRAVWYNRVQSLNPGAPVIMACCKADRLTEEREVSMLREHVERAVHDLPHVEVCLNCSAKTLRMVADVFFYALKSVLYPLQPLYDRLEKRLRPLCVRALKRVFVMCDADGDGALCDAELNAFQLACFGMALDESELQNVKQIVASKMPSGVSPRGVTLEGFLFLHVLFIERGRLESTWAVLRKFGYNDGVVLSDDALDRLNFYLPQDQVWELSDAALDFLVRQFSAVDDDRDGLISWQQLDALCATIPPPMWQGEPWSHLLVPGMYGSAHKLEAFLLKWQLHVMLDPRTAYSHLLYLGYGGPDGAGGPALLARGVRRRTDKRHRADLAARTTLQCFVFGPRGAGKTSLLRALVGQKPEGPPTPAPGPSGMAGVLAPPAAGTGLDGLGTLSALPALQPSAAGEAGPVSTAEGGEGDAVSAVLAKAVGVSWTAVSLVKGPDDKERTLILHEIGEECESQMLTTAALAAHGAPGPLIPHHHTSGAAAGPGGHTTGSGGGLAPSLELSRADVACFVFDCSNPASFRAAVELLVKVSTFAGDTLPCVLVAAKDELAMSTQMENMVASVVRELQVHDMVRTSAQLGEMNDLFSTLVGAAVNPEGWIPETPARKAHRMFVRKVVTGAAVFTATAGLAYLGYTLWHWAHTAPSDSAGPSALPPSSVRHNSSRGSGSGGGSGSGASSYAAHRALPSSTQPPPSSAQQGGGSSTPGAPAHAGAAPTHRSASSSEPPQRSAPASSNFNSGDTGEPWTLAGFFAWLSSLFGSAGSDSPTSGSGHAGSTGGVGASGGAQVPVRATSVAEGPAASGAAGLGDQWAKTACVDSASGRLKPGGAKDAGPLSLNRNEWAGYGRCGDGHDSGLVGASVRAPQGERRAWEGGLAGVSGSAGWGLERGLKHTQGNQGSEVGQPQLVGRDAVRHGPGMTFGTAEAVASGGNSSESSCSTGRGSGLWTVGAVAAVSVLVNSLLWSHE